MPELRPRGGTSADLPANVLLDDGKNLGEVEQWLSIGVGALIAGVGLQQAAARRDGAGTLLGVVGAVAGGALIARGATGRCPAKAALTGDSREREEADAQGWRTASVASNAVTIGKDRQELYAFWRDFQYLAGFMDNIDSITVQDDRRSHWVVKAPAGRTVEWDAVVTADIPGEHIAWESGPGADIKNAGWVEFKDAPGGRGTVVRAHIAYEAPGGPLGRLLATMFQREPQLQARRDLKRFKALMEAGEVPVSTKPDYAAPSARAA